MKRQLEACFGRMSKLSPGEIEMAGSLTNQPGVDRAWEHWVKRLDNVSS
jgi:hypothetical protein